MARKLLGGYNDFATRTAARSQRTVGPCSIEALTALLAEAELMSDLLGLSVPSAHITKARDALRRSTAS